MMQTFIEIERYGDFDVKYTDCVMVSPIERDVDKIVKDFCEIMGFESTSGLQYSQVYETINAFIDYLGVIGFTKLKTSKVCFSD